MLVQMLLTGLLLGAPEASVSYKKKVMVDPAYRPSRSAAQIEETLRKARAPKRVAPAVVYTTRVVERRRRWSIPISVGIGLGYHGGYHGGWNYGVSLAYSSWYDGLGIGLGYYGGHRHHHHGHRYRYRGRRYR